MSDEEKNPKAEAAAEKARAKAMRPWYKKKRFIIPLGIVALVIVIAIASAGGDGVDVDTAADNGATEEETTTAGLNEPARDGKFEFVVTGIECGIEGVGDENFGKQAQGQYCFVSVRVTNIGDEPQTLFADNQKLFDGQGREFSPDTEAAIYADEAQTIFEEINPGNTLEGVIIFDIPDDATPTTVELHDSAFSGGVEVRLS